ncbi:MAG: DegT/DnrJ/EryC1/StrS family aminotransferase, partial [Chthoniobacterales bacterium]
FCLSRMQVPLLDIKTQNAALEPALTQAFQRVFQSGKFILGEEVEGFEKEVCAYTGAKHAVALSSGTDALLVAFLALGIGAGDEVICPSYTFFASAGCIARTGAKPVFVDSLEDTFNLDPQKLEEKITPKTRAILVVHLFGQAAAMNEIREIAKRHNLPVIEDAAQTLGARYEDQAVGTMGCFGTYSFFPSKNLGGFGDAGLLVTNDDALAEKSLRLRNHGMHPKYHHSMIGGNFRIDALQAALLRVKLPHLDTYCEKRAKNAAQYQKLLAKVEGIILPAVKAGNHCIWNQFTLRVKNGKRDALRDYLAGQGIGSEIYYPIPMHQQECFHYLNYKREDFPIASQLAEEALSIPIYPELAEAQIDYVAEKICQFKA